MSQPPWSNRTTLNMAVIRMSLWMIQVPPCLCSKCAQSVQSFGVSKEDVYSQLLDQYQLGIHQILMNSVANTPCLNICSGTKNSIGTTSHVAMHLEVLCREPLHSTNCSNCSNTIWLCSKQVHWLHYNRGAGLSLEDGTTAHSMVPCLDDIHLACSRYL